MDNKEDIINDLLKDLKLDEAIKVELPSKGVGYNFENPDDPFAYLRPMVFEDEKVLSKIKKSNFDVINTLLERCVSNLDIKELYIFDKLFLILKLREISYGESYESTVICPECSYEGQIKVDIKNLQVNEVPEEFSKTVTLTLPKLGKEIEVNRVKIKDEKYTTNPDVLENSLWRFIKRIDTVKDPTVISAVVKKLPLVDIKTILKALASDEYGVNPKVVYECSHCRAESILNLPIDSNFFNVN